MAADLLPQKFCDGNIAPLLHCLLNVNNRLLGNDLYAAFITQYFSAVLRDDSAALDDFRNRAEHYGGKQREILEQILARADDFTSPEPDSRETIDMLWAEHMANGNEKPVREMISMLALPETEDTIPLLNTLMASFVCNIPRMYNVHTMLETELETSDSLYRERIGTIINGVSSLGKMSANHVRRGENFFRLHEYEKAREEYRRALKVFPHYPGAYIGIANTYEFTGDRSTAMAYSRKASVVDEDNGMAEYNMGRLLFLEGRYEEALPHYKKAHEELMRIGDEWSKDCWGSWSYFNKVKKEVSNYADALKDQTLSSSQSAFSILHNRKDDTFRQSPIVDMH